jgi:pimeloyl-ACP methyl ester carboxylesterase
VLLLIASATLPGQNERARMLARIARYGVACDAILLVIAAAAGFLYERNASRRDAELYRPPGRLIDIGGYKLHIHCEGSNGPTVVLEYGLEGSYLDWRLVQPELARFTRVCAYDRAGYGWSDPSPRARIPSAMAEELHSLLHAAGEPSPYILVAHSFASYNAVMFAHQFPNEMRGLVLVDGPPALSHYPCPLRRLVTTRAMQFLIPLGLPRWRGWCGGAAPSDLRGEKQAITCRPSLYATYYRENAERPASAQQIRAITSLGDIPLIVIARDPSFPYVVEGAEWELIQKQKLSLSTHAELVVATGSGHDIPLRRPDLIISAVKKIAAQSPGTGGHPGKSGR